MTGDVRIQITAVHRRPDTDPERIETSSSGRYYFRGGKHYAEFETADPEGRESSQTRLSLKEGILEIRRTGIVQSLLIFEEKRQNRSQYVTPFGSMLAETDVKSLQTIVQEELLQISVEYTLSLNGEKVADSSARIRITPGTEV